MRQQTIVNRSKFEGQGLGVGLFSFIYVFSIAESRNSNAFLFFPLQTSHKLWKIDVKFDDCRHSLADSGSSKHNSSVSAFFFFFFNSDFTLSVCLTS